MKREPIKDVKVTLTPMELLNAIDSYWSGYPSGAHPLDPSALITYEETPIAMMIRRTIRAERQKVEREAGDRDKLLKKFDNKEGRKILEKVGIIL